MPHCFSSLTLGGNPSGMAMRKGKSACEGRGGGLAADTISGRRRGEILGRKRLEAAHPRPRHATLALRPHATLHVPEQLTVCSSSQLPSASCSLSPFPGPVRADHTLLFVRPPPRSASFSRTLSSPLPTTTTHAVGPLPTSSPHVSPPGTVSSLRSSMRKKLALRPARPRRTSMVPVMCAAARSAEPGMPGKPAMKSRCGRGRRVLWDEGAQ